MQQSETSSSAPQWLVVTAFAAVWLFWGSTYLGIRFAVETIPPFLMAGARFVVAGGILYGVLRLRGVPDPGFLHWRNATIVGTFLLLGGNGLVSWAEQKVPSALAALIIGATPFWFVLLEWLRPRGIRPTLQTTVGLVIGFIGLGMLVGTREALRQNEIHPAGAVALIFAGLLWAIGSLYARYTAKPSVPLMGIALQMIAGGVALFLAGAFTGEPGRFGWTEISSRSAWAWVYLTVFGSLVGFTAYSWLLKVATPAKVSTYAYVNPVIAVFLGWAIGGETITSRILVAAAVIVVGVVIITVRRSVSART
jgi:drug/metabolite transporter (DMT)-like permease